MQICQKLMYKQPEKAKKGKNCHFSTKKHKKHLQRIA
jgi:hypothetical protein